MEYSNFSEEIDREISKRRNKWTLTALNWLSFDDVSQIIRFHIFKKLSLYNELEPFLPWVNRVISNQIRNIIRNNYSNYARPCLKCDAAEGENLCRIFTKQCGDCPLYAKWEKSKKSAYNTKLPISINAIETQVPEQHHYDIDFDRSIPEFHRHMKKILKANEWKIYSYLFIDFLPEDKLAEHMGYKSTETGRMAGYKTIKNAKKKILLLAKKIAYQEMDI